VRGGRGVGDLVRGGVRGVGDGRILISGGEGGREGGKRDESEGRLEKNS
jgi:hypothetical protein